jgi:hypothetical protein
MSPQSDKETRQRTSNAPNALFRNPGNLLKRPCGQKTRESTATRWEQLGNEPSRQTSTLLPTQWSTILSKAATRTQFLRAVWSSARTSGTQIRYASWSRLDSMKSICFGCGPWLGGSNKVIAAAVESFSRQGQTFDYRRSAQPPLPNQMEALVAVNNELTEGECVDICFSLRPELN